MAVQLLPFQELADIPAVAQRHRCAIRALTITSIVLVFLLLVLAVPTGVALSGYIGNIYIYIFNAYLIGFGIGLLTLTIVFVLLSSIISLRNTDKWVSTDVCCNLMRSQPACCTKSCGGNKHCCARLSSVHIATSVFSSILLLLFVTGFITGCLPSHGSTYANSYHSHSSSERSNAGDCVPLQQTTTRGPVPDSSDYSYSYYSQQADAGGGKLQDTYLGAEDKVDCFVFKTSHQCDPRHCEWKRDVNFDEDVEEVPEYVRRCAILAIFDVPSIILLICLVATTARAAWLVRAIEQEQADLAVLPPNKMVTQFATGNMMMMK